MSLATKATQLVVLMPVFNDWASAAQVTAGLDRELALPVQVSILLVDDASSEPIPTPFLPSVPVKIRAIYRLRLRRNLGHQRAIAIGLTWIHEKLPCDVVVVMDADGEDKPEDVPKLLNMLQRSSGERIVFAARHRVSKGVVFGTFYFLYRMLHQWLTGIPVRIGNFSAVPSCAVSSLASVSELWNHYAAAVLKAGLPYETVPIRRGTRISGRSHMSFVSLVTHGLSAISVFADTVGVRLLVAASIASLGVLALLVLVLVVKLATALAIPGWATYVSAFLLIALLHLFTIAVVLSVSILAGRNNLTFVPLRDYGYFIQAVDHLSYDNG